MSEELEYAFYFDEENGEVSVIGIPEIKESGVYPDGEWLISAGKNSGMPYTRLMPNPESVLPTVDIPFGVWRIDSTRNDGFPFTELMPVPLPNGAFKDVAELTEIYIPESVKKIGSYSFSGTSLTAVRIAPDCEYSETSFPSGCVVEFYGGGDYGQLYDADGFALLDSEGARIYSRSENNG